MLRNVTFLKNEVALNIDVRCPGYIRLKKSMTQNNMDYIIPLFKYTHINELYLFKYIGKYLERYSVFLTSYLWRKEWNRTRKIVSLYCLHF